MSNRREVADVVRDAIMRLTYVSHFKDVAIASSPPNSERFSAYYSVWSALARMQDYEPYAQEPRPPRTRWNEDQDDDFYDFEEGQL